MARITFSWLLGVGALLFGVFAVYLGLQQEGVAFARNILAAALSSKQQRGGTSAADAPPPVVVIDGTRNITYLGARFAEVEHFQNIFYGEDTSGKNRFAPPVPVQPPKGAVIDATQPGAWCPQGTGDVLPFTSRVTNVSENCLSLRIARPRGTQSNAKLPVAVWIHGGGHALGSGAEVLYTPDGLVHQATVDGQPLIFVAINYRLGFFGFATSKAMIEAKQTNAGLRDQRAALEWVRDNIESFGGDPHKVTAIGQSVGASDISLQLTAFGGKGGTLFQKAIMMSGGPGLNFNTKSDLVANNTAAVAEQVGCVQNGDSQSAATLECLRAAPVDALTNISVTAARAARPPFGEGFFFPTYDADFVPDRPSELVRAGKVVQGVPIIASWVTNDGAWYPDLTTSTDGQVLASFGRWLIGHSESTKQKLLQLYPLEDFATMVRPADVGTISPQYYRAAQINKDLWFTCPVLDFAWQYIKKGGLDPSQMRMYEHNATRYTPVFEYMGVSAWRVAHLSDIPYVLNVQQLGGGADNSDPQLERSKTMSRTIAKFVTSGTPEGAQGGVESWPAAFAGVTPDELKTEFPSKLLLQLFSEPYGNVPITVTKTGNKNRLSTAAEQAIGWEKLFDRCEFINSEKVREESGV